MDKPQEHKERDHLRSEVEATKTKLAELLKVLEGEEYRNDTDFLGGGNVGDIGYEETAHKAKEVYEQAQLVAQSAGQLAGWH